MAKSSTSFQKGHGSYYAERRKLTESAIKKKLKDSGEEMLDYLIHCARDTELKPEVRIRAADRFLTHTLLQPNFNENIEIENNNSLAVLDFIKCLQNEIPVEKITLIIDKLKDMQQNINE